MWIWNVPGKNNKVSTLSIQHQVGTEQNRWTTSNYKDVQRDHALQPSSDRTGTWFSTKIVYVQGHCKGEHGDGAYLLASGVKKGV